ncbi:MAG: hypothetical protein SFU86_06555 [Pirellulaceae bacterium]|nr:hypothetical protein [Pirellulaceae bacterium]
MVLAKKVGWGVAAAALLAVGAAIAADGVKLEGIKCLIAGGKAAKAEHAVDYKGGKVFFCCPNCPKSFSADPAKFAAKANHQLFATGQAKQTACPLTGEAVDSATKVKVGGVEVAFCCDMCKAQAEQAQDPVSVVFSDKAFEKGFKVGK